MLDIKWIRENHAVLKIACAQKRVDLDVDALLELDRQLLALKKKNQRFAEEKNKNAASMKSASIKERQDIIERGRSINKEIENLKPEIDSIQEKLNAALSMAPMIPDPNAPLGQDEHDNVELRKWGKKPEFNFQVRDHVQILEKNNWAELERVAKIAGSRSYSLKGDLVFIELALLRLALQKLADKGFTMMSLPSLAREFAFFGSGHFPTGKDQAYHLSSDNLFLTGTAEVAINALHSGEILEETDLPIYYGALSPCFRREAGSAGRDVRGLMRVHQFNKVEQYILCRADPAEALKLQALLLETSEEILQSLELHYRVVEVCTGDMGAGKFKMFDIETWVPSEKRYRETHSCSSLHDWQARRTQLRYRDSKGQVHYCFTLNNTAIATPRILVSLIEQHQKADGSVAFPKSLEPYWKPQKNA